jgi:hypothetical protein
VASRRTFTERVTLGERAFTGWAPPRGLRRELPLGEGSVVRKLPFAERKPALGEGPESCSDIKIDKILKVER